MYYYETLFWIMCYNRFLPVLWCDSRWVNLCVHLCNVGEFADLQFLAAPDISPNQAWNKVAFGPEPHTGELSARLHSTHKYKPQDPPRAKVFSIHCLHSKTLKGKDVANFGTVCARVWGMHYCACKQKGGAHGLLRPVLLLSRWRVVGRDGMQHKGDFHWLVRTAKRRIGGIGGEVQTLQ